MSPKTHIKEKLKRYFILKDRNHHHNYNHNLKIILKIILIFRAKTILSDLGLLSIKDHIVGVPNSNQKSISGGQRRRLSMAQELLGSPSILFLDEVSTLVYLIYFFKDIFISY